MEAIKPYAQIYSDINGQEILKKIEVCGKIYYKPECSEEISTEKIVENLIKKGYENTLEHNTITVKFVVDQLLGCKIGGQVAPKNFEKEITFIIPPHLDYKSAGWNIWKETMKVCEDAYFKLLDIGLTAQEATIVLPNSVKTEIVKTASIRDWKKFFKSKTTNMSDSQMDEVIRPLLNDLKTLIPVVFDDIT